MQKNFKVKHTPPPWEIKRGSDIYSGSRFIASTGGPRSADFPESIIIVDHANAEIIVTAVNSHEALLEGTKKYIADLEKAEENGALTMTGISELKKYRAVIAEVSRDEKN